MADKDAKFGALQQQGTLNPRPKMSATNYFFRTTFSIPAIWSRSSTRCCAECRPKASR